MFLLRSFRIIWRAVEQFGENRGSQMGAALAYYALFSLAPLLVIAIFIAGLFLGEDTARESAMQAIRTNMGDQVAEFTENVLTNSSNSAQGVWAPILAVVVLILAALNLFFQIRVSLATIWKLPPPGGNSFLGLLLSYVLAIAMVLIVGLLLVALVAVSTILALALEFMQDQFPPLPISWKLLEFLISFIFTTVLFALIYRIMSARQIAWGYVIYGSVITSLLFTIGKTLLGWYFAYVDVASAYGAGGSLVVFLIWIYYSAQIMIFGAELVQARRTI